MKNLSIIEPQIEKHYMFIKKTCMRTKMDKFIEILFIPWLNR